MALTSAGPRRSNRTTLALLASATLAALTLAACGSSGPADRFQAAGPTEPTVAPPSTIASGPPAPDVDRAAESLLVDPLSPAPEDALDLIAASDDLRFAWYLTELLRYQPPGDARDPLAARLGRLTGVDPPPDIDTRTGGATDVWAFYVDILVAWDVPAPPDYLRAKRTLHLAHDPAAAPFFDDEADLDWRLVAGTGAARDELTPLDDPVTVPADTATVDDADPAADWLPADEAVFGVHVAGEWRAYPLRVVRAHELVNDTLGQRRVVVAYCDVCAAAAAWFADAHRDPDDADPADRDPAAVTGTDGLGTLAFGSSGLAWRGAPLAYERNTASLFDLYDGRAVSGRMADAGVTLEPLTTVTTTWGEWVADHPTTTVIAADGGVGRIYLDEPRSSAPSPWPVGRRDDRLDAHERVLGVHADGPGRDDSATVAFPIEDARRGLADDGALAWSGVEVVVEGGGLVVRDRLTGEVVPSHESYWVTWSQFHPDTRLWSPGS